MTMHEPSAIPVPVTERVRHDTRRRVLTVTSAERITPNMLRIELAGDELGDFASAAPDDHVKLIFAGDDDQTIMREYTPRRFDTEKRSLVIDFALHDSGPATLWALGTKPGDELQIGGPRGSRVISGDIERWLLIGDETALPAIGRRIEEAAPGAKITALVCIPDDADMQSFETGADLDTLWIARDGGAATDPAFLLDTLKSIDLTARTFVWIAAEGSVTREVRRYLNEERGHPLPWMKAAGYWVHGKADTKESFD